MMSGVKSTIIKIIRDAIAQSYKLGKEHGATAERLKWADRLTSLGIEQSYVILEWTAESMRENTWINDGIGKDEPPKRKKERHIIKHLGGLHNGSTRADRTT